MESNENWVCEKEVEKNTEQIAVNRKVFIVLRLKFEVNLLKAHFSKNGK